jgi:hypothetical protein
MIIEVKRYINDNFFEWNQFLDFCKTTSFLFKRDFISYHESRFIDFSLMVYGDGKLVALVPANLDHNRLVSHQGLTFGGIALLDNIRLYEIVEIVKSILIYLKNQNIDKWVFKCMPRIYHTRPADELDWILFKLDAKLYRRDSALVIDNRVSALEYQERRRRSIKKATNRKIEIREGFSEIQQFWTQVLTPNLIAKHGVAPVHSLAEIELLASRFAENIKQFSIYLDGIIVAGCMIFLYNNVAHAQYISGTEMGRRTGCLDYLFDYLIKAKYSNCSYFDFGICNEQNGQYINKGLLDWKEGFGARTIIHDFYEINVCSFNLLNDFLV